MSIQSAVRAKSSVGMHRGLTIQNNKVKLSSQVRNSCQNSENPTSALVNSLALKTSKTFLVKNSNQSSMKNELMSNASVPRDNIDARSKVLMAIGK